VLKYENLQRWSALSFKGGESPALRIAVWEPCVEPLSELLDKNRDTPYLKQQWGFEHYEPELQKGFGFQHIAQVAGVEDGYLITEIALKRKNLEAISVSCGVLFGMLMFFPGRCERLLKQEPPTDIRHLQFMCIQNFLRAEGDFHAAPLGGTVSPILTHWVENIKTFPRHGIAEAMRCTWNAVGPFPIHKQRRETESIHFRARRGENGSFFLSCPGNACDISTVDWWHRKSGEGHDLDCHNLDTPAQQITLLSGLAVMHEMADKDIHPRPPL